jgi:hypothetical protein
VPRLSCSTPKKPKACKLQAFGFFFLLFTFYFLTAHEAPFNVSNQQLNQWTRARAAPETGATQDLHHCA